MMDIALKEWAVVCDLLLAGDLAILLRKGGIEESAGPGRFELRYDRFALFPAWEHQDPDRIKPAYRDRVEVFDAEPAEVTLRGMGVVYPSTIWPVPSRAAFDQLDDLHCWTTEQIDMRFDYKPERPLYLMAVRAYQLREPQTIPLREDYAGCKSWVPLAEEDEVDTTDASPVLSDDAFQQIVDRINATFERAQDAVE
jgi:hypothetical protein